jgi:hypothetical protein
MALFATLLASTEAGFMAQRGGTCLIRR